MIVKSFRSVLWVGAVATAAIGCYMVSLQVASTRSELEGVEQRILLARRDIRMLETELGTRGRLVQLERWNLDILALAAPTSGQFVRGEAQLASLVRPQPAAPLDTPLRVADADEVVAKPKAVLAVATKAAKLEADDFKPDLVPPRAAPEGPRVILASAPMPKPDTLPRPRPAARDEPGKPAKSEKAKPAEPKIAAAPKPKIEKAKPPAPRVAAASRPDKPAKAKGAKVRLASVGDSGE